MGSDGDLKSYVLDKLMSLLGYSQNAVVQFVIGLTGIFVVTIVAMLSIGNSIFYRPKDKQVYNSWKETNFATQWCYENYIQVRSMKRARDIRDQLVGLLERVDIELTSNLNDLEAIKKAITSGFFPHSSRLQKNGSYKTVKHPQTVLIHPNTGLVLLRWLAYHELVLTAKEYMRQVTELKPNWLVEIAPHYYQMKDVEDQQAVTN